MSYIQYIPAGVAWQSIYHYDNKYDIQKVSRVRNGFDFNISSKNSLTQ